MQAISNFTGSTKFDPKRKGKEKVDIGEKMKTTHPKNHRALEQDLLVFSPRIWRI